MMQTALFFGSFNPIHVGHLIIANTMLQQQGVGEVWIVVSPQNPLKAADTLLADSRRLRMVELAIEGVSGLRACDVELGLPRPSYTVNTLRALAERYPEREFCLVMGSDNLQVFPSWREYQYILDHYRLLVYPRPGSERCPLANHPSVQMVDVPMMDLSSSFIRARLQAGGDVRYMVVDSVYNYIKDNCLYAKVD